MVGDQLYERYNFQRTALAKQFHLWEAIIYGKGLEKKDGNDVKLEMGINTGSLSIGFVKGSKCDVCFIWCRTRNKWSCL